MTQLKAQYPSINIVGLDVYATILQDINSPAAFGLINVTSPAQGTSVNPDAYVFWDKLHPTTKAGQLLAMAALQVLPPSFLQAPTTTDSPTMPPVAMIVLAALLVGAGLWRVPRRE